jgi:hypothetical protein
LPNQKELNSIVEQRNWDPAINATVFPNTPITYFWLASPFAPDAGYAWYVNFFDGYDGVSIKGNLYAVRLVRGGQYALLSVSKAGSGSGAVISSLPGIDCGQFCKGSFANEMFTAGQVVLTATPDANSDFGGWTNCPSASGTQCTVGAAGDRTVTATFTLKAVACGTIWNTGALQFKLIGISCDTGTDNTVRKIFGDELDPDAYYNDWYLWKVDPVTNASVGVGLDDVLQPQQQGYWMKTRANVIVDVAGTVTAPPTLEGNVASGCPTNSGCFPSPLTPPDINETKQNNLVGQPFPYAVKWTDMRFVVNNIAYTPSAAETASYAAKTFWRYNGSGYNTYDDTTPGASNTWWQANEGLFVRLLPGARPFTGTKLWTPALQAQPLSAPLAADTVEPTADRVAMAGGSTKARGEAEQRAHRAAHGHANEGLDSGDVAGHEWYVRLSVAAPAEKLEDAGNLLGQLADAKTGFDEHDLPELPPPDFGPYLSIVFPHSEWGQMDADYSTDYHPLSRGRQRDT